LARNQDNGSECGGLYIRGLVLVC